jgi:predicted nuclease of predicted toxin-antitoxin system
VAPGSVQLRLEGPIVEATTPLAGMEPVLLIDLAAGQLVGLMSEVADPQLDEDVVVGHLRSLGPRVARHIQTLAAELLSDDVDLDLSWRRFGKPPEVGQLHRQNASLLRDIIRRSHVENEPITLVGQLVTISRVRPAAIVLDSGQIVTLMVDEQLSADLGPFFNQRVRIEAEETVTHQAATGRDKYQYRLLAVDLAAADDSSDDLAQDRTDG